MKSWFFYLSSVIVTEWMTISRGFPQGSGLSPLTYLLTYTYLFNILPGNFRSNVGLPHLPSSLLMTSHFLYTANPSLSAVAENLTASFYAVKEFCDSHELKINPEKTRLTVFKKTRKINTGWLSNYAWQPYYQASENSQTPGCRLRSTSYFRATYWQCNQQMPRTLGYFGKSYSLSP